MGALSVLVGSTSSLAFAVRGGAAAVVLPAADVPGPITFANLDLLVSGTRPGVKFYGGPSAGLVFGSSWLLGGVAGVRNEFGSSRWGWFAEAKARMSVGDNLVNSGTVVPGLNLGITYRF